MTLAQLMTAHDHAAAKTEGLPYVRSFQDPRRPELEARLARLTTAEDALLDQLVLAPCASDGEFFAKAAHIARAGFGDPAYAECVADPALAAATRAYLKQRGMH
jgi:hypothetical protein